MIRGSGLASGLDTQSLISQLVSLQRQPILRYQADQRVAEARISTLGSLTSQLNTLSDKFEDLSNLSELLSYKATSSDEDIFTASADGTAAPGSYEIEVSQLASAEKNRSAAFADGTAAVSGTTLDITVFGESAVSVEIPDGASLADARDLINSSGAQVSASIINTGSGSYLTMTSLKEGHEIGGSASDAITITETVTGAGGQALSLSEVQTAQNAQLTIDGLAIESSSNDVDSAVTGVSLSLSKVTTAGSPLQLTVESDTEEVKATMQEVADLYNDVMDTLRRDDMKSTSLARLLQGDLQNLFSSAVPGATDFVNLAAIGLESSFTTGKLELDATMLEDALSDDPLAVAALFTTATTGLGTTLPDLLDRYTNSDTGIIDASEDSYRAEVDRLQNSIDSKERNLETYEASLVRRFTNLELAISQTQSAFSGLLPF